MINRNEWIKSLIFAIVLTACCWGFVRWVRSWTVFEWSQVADLALAAGVIVGMIVYVKYRYDIKETEKQNELKKNLLDDLEKFRKK